MSHSLSLHLTIAEWILERGEAVSAYDVSEHFGITIYQARAFLTILEKDNAIETQRGHVIPATGRNTSKRSARKIKVISIHREKITQFGFATGVHIFRTTGTERIQPGVDCG